MSMTVEQAINSRRATRVYSDQPIPDEVLDRVVNLALEAPSAFNLQLRDLVVVRDQALKDALTESSGQRQFAAAPAVLIAVTLEEVVPEDVDQILPAAYVEKIKGWKAGLDAAGLREAAMRDAMLMAGFALIAAQAEGLSTSPTTGWDEAKVKEIIGLGDRSDRGIALITALGYPAEHPEHPGRQVSRRVNDTYTN